MYYNKHLTTTIMVKMKMEISGISQEIIIINNKMIRGKLYNTNLMMSLICLLSINKGKIYPIMIKITMMKKTI